MKILQVCNHFYPCIGGVERHVEDLCRNLITLGHRSDVSCLNACAQSTRKLPTFEEYSGIKIFRVPFLNLRIYKLAPSILRYISNCDVIHVHGLGFFSDFLGLTRFIHKKPLFLSTHGGIFHTPAFSLLKKIYFNFWCRFVLKRFRVIAVSRHDERLFSKFADVRFIPNAIEVGDFEIDGEPEDNSFIFVGRISKNKRVDSLIRALAFVNKEIPVKLYIVGEDWEGLQSDLRKLAETEGLNALFTGALPKEEVVKYLSKAKFFVSASEYEGFGIAVVEAMAAGLIPIVNDIETFREIVIDGENGFIANFSNPKVVGNAISKILKMDLKEIRRNAKETAKRYDWKNVVKEIEKMYIDSGRG